MGSGRIAGTTSRTCPSRPANPVPHGLDWPLVPGSNRPFLVHMGFHPFVSPAAHPRLQTCPVPLAVEPSSYELARRYLERNEWPPADRVRTEEFLAAVDYNFPKPTASEPRPDRGGRTVAHQRRGLLPLAGRRPGPADRSAKHAPLHLVLLIDTSTSMRWGSRMEIVRRALRDLPGIVGPRIGSRW